MLLILRSMTSTDDRLWYTPPPFSPFEFDDSYLPGDQHPRARRWMSGFNGAIGEPAQNVQLGWRSDSGAQVAIGTFEDKAQFTDSSGRMSAVWMLDGLQFASPGPPVAYAVKSGTDMQRLAQQTSCGSKVSSWSMALRPGRSERSFVDSTLATPGQEMS